MNDRKSRKKDGSPKGKRVALNKMQRAFWLHYAKNADWVAALHHAYPTSKKWRSEGWHAVISRLRTGPTSALGWALVDEVRKPAMEMATLDYGTLLQHVADMLVQNKQLFISTKDVKYSLEFRKMALLGGRMLGLDRPPALPDPTLIEGTATRVDELPDHELFERAGIAQGSAPTGDRHDAGERSEELGRFRDLLGRTPASAPPQDAVHVPADGGGPPDDASDGVHAPGGSQVYLLQRVRAGLDGRAPPGRCTHCGEPHDGPCETVREEGS